MAFFRGWGQHQARWLLPREKFDIHSTANCPPFLGEDSIQVTSSTSSRHTKLLLISPGIFCPAKARHIIWPVVNRFLKRDGLPRWWPFRIIFFASHLKPLNLQNKPVESSSTQAPKNAIVHVSDEQKLDFYVPITSPHQFHSEERELPSPLLFEAFHIWAWLTLSRNAIYLHCQLRQIKSSLINSSKQTDH